MIEQRLNAGLYTGKLGLNVLAVGVSDYSKFGQKVKIFQLSIRTFVAVWANVY